MDRYLDIEDKRQILDRIEALEFVVKNAKPRDFSYCPHICGECATKRKPREWSYCVRHDRAAIFGIHEFDRRFCEIIKVQEVI